MFMSLGFRRDIYSWLCLELQMKTVSRYTTIAGLGILATLLFASPLLLTTFAWTTTPGTPFTCVTSTNTWSSTCATNPSFAIGTTVYDQAKLTLSNAGTPYGSVYFAVAKGTCADYGSTIINQTYAVTGTGTTYPYESISTTAYGAGSYVWLVHFYAPPATGGGQYPRYPTTGNDCEPFTLTAAYVPTPQFPLGMAVVLAAALPAMLLIKRKFSTTSFQTL